MQALAIEALGWLQEAEPARTLPVEIGPLPVIDADPLLVRQVLVNLIGNALKFSSQAAQPRVEVGVAWPDGGGDPVFHVRDNGVGFEPEAAGQLFRPFQRLHGARFPGSGVGLSIVRRIVDHHGGRVWAEGAPGAGACVFFSLQ
ncbi:ATP-binding protein [Piscinibacter sakaiensis]|uniref:sensor histidine kinase n=1 Tax=Piscinibacter sakaiensis TaxID=1547922 RepID=UPI003728D3ED